MNVQLTPMNHHRHMKTLPIIAGLLFFVWSSLITAQTDRLTLNLKDANIRTLIETVAEATGKNFVIDPRVKAKVTVVSTQPMNKEELYEVFLSILQVHGYSAVPVGEVIKIVPDVNAKQGPVRVTDPESPGIGDQLVTRVIQINNVAAPQLVPILRPLIPQQGHLAAYASSNVLVVSDRAANIERISQIIRRIDQPDSQQIEVIPLDYASASEIVRIISALSQKDVKKRPVRGKPILAADERTNSVLLSGDKSARLRIRALIAHLDTPLEDGGNSQVVFLKFAQAEDLAPILLGVAQQQLKPKSSKGKASSSSTSRATKGIDIQADPRNNALIITAPPAQFNRLRSVIRQLDIRRAQVLVESIIAEVTLDLARDLGVEALALPGEGDEGPVIVSNIGGTARTGGSLVDILQDPFSIGAGMFAGGASIGSNGIPNWAFLVRALAGDAATNILSTPTLVMLDNEEAQIVVGQNVPFITGSFTQTGTAASNPFQTIERQDVGLTLNITPQINEGDTIKLEIEQEVSQLTATAQVVDSSDLITNTRTIKTTVLVEDNAVLVLGGLIEDEFRDREQKVPLLGDIPVLGWLFRSSNTEKVKRNLMVFIHPAIIRNRATATAYTNRKYSYMQARQIEAGIDERGLIKDTRGQLPDLDDLVTRVPPQEKMDPPPKDMDAFIDMDQL